MSNEMDDADTAEILQQPPAVEDDMTCPCGATVRVTDDPPAVMHTMPMCEDFAKRDALDYVRWLNEQLEALPDA